MSRCVQDDVEFVYSRQDPVEVHVHIYEAERLTAIGGAVGTPDPYVRVTCCDQSIETKVVSTALLCNCKACA